VLAARYRVVTASADAIGAERFAVIAEREATATALGLADRADAIVLLSPVRVDGVPTVEGPVLIFAGEDDAASPGAAEALNDVIATSTLGLLPGIGDDVLAEAGPTIVPMVYEYLRARYLAEPHGHADEGVVRIQLERRPPWIDDDEEDA
jgi:pimeloyl-ACP methyl ester carboxylesterase